MSNAENWSPRDLAKLVKNGDINALAQLGYLSYDDADYIADYYDSYESHKGRNPVADDDQRYMKLIRRAATRELNEAVGEGNIARIAYAIGSDNNKNDIADWNKSEKLKDLIRKQPKYTDFTNNVFQSIIFSSNIPPTGRGKTSFGYLLTELAQDVHDNIKIRSSNPSDDYDNIPQYYNQLEHWIKSTDGEKMIMLDEAKQYLMYRDQTAGKYLSKLLALTRHNRTHIIIISHTGAGVPADIRRQMYFIDKKTEKKAIIGYGLDDFDDGNRYQVSNEMLEYSQIPHTSVDYKSEGERSINLIFDEDGDTVEIENKNQDDKNQDDNIFDIGEFYICDDWESEEKNNDGYMCHVNECNRKYTSSSEVPICVEHRDEYL